MSFNNVLIAGVPATGKSWLGKWLAEKHGYVHIDAEVAGGTDFDQVGIHSEWNDLILTGSATKFANSIQRLSRPVVVNWGFPTRYLYVVSALQAEGFRAWWFQASKDLARRAFVMRGGISPECFDRQMADIEREWLLIKSVFQLRIVEGLCADGSQRTPQEIWREILKLG